MQFIALDFKRHHGKLPGLTTCDNTHVRSAMVHARYFGTFSKQLYLRFMDFMKILSWRAKIKRTKEQFFYGANKSVSPTRIESSIVMLAPIRAHPLSVRAA